MPRIIRKLLSSVVVLSAVQSRRKGSVRPRRRSRPDFTSAEAYDQLGEHSLASVAYHAPKDGVESWARERRSPAVTQEQYGVISEVPILPACPFDELASLAPSVEPVHRKEPRISTHRHDVAVPTTGELRRVWTHSDLEMSRIKSRLYERLASLSAELAAVSQRITDMTQYLGVIRREESLLAAAM